MTSLAPTPIGGHVNARAGRLGLVKVMGLACPALALAGAVACVTVTSPPPVEGRVAYQRSCATCHGSDGRGAPPAYPPLSGHVPRLLALDGGRLHLLRVLLFGMSGPIEVDGQDYNGVMAAVDYYTDDDLAALLEHVATAWGNAQALPPGHVPFTRAEIAALRQADLDAVDVHELRPSAGRVARASRVGH